jgi:hypothetical protein
MPERRRPRKGEGAEPQEGRQLSKEASQPFDERHSEEQMAARLRSGRVEARERTHREAGAIIGGGRTLERKKPKGATCYATG